MTATRQVAMVERLTQVRRERDLYQRLLRLGEEQHLEPLLREALVLIVEVTGARQGYLELHGDDDATLTSIACGFSTAEIDRVRDAISCGILAHALATGETISTAAATEDARFRNRDSILRLHLGAVLCTPIGTNPPIGALYLQGRQHGLDFTPEHRAVAELCAGHLATLAERLLARERHGAGDPTRSLRARLRLDGIVGRSPALAGVLRLVRLVAPLEVAVLLTGDSGTGKSQLARAIHDNSPRAAGPFLELNCAALPEGLIESELFGAVRGAHSTATQPIVGKVAAAHRGTLLLDEVAELSGAAQAKLLHVLQSGRYWPLGSSRAVDADVRIVATTNVDLDEAVAGGRMRQDFRHRLEVVPIRLPSLAERRMDIAPLAEHFAMVACQRHRLPVLCLSPNAVRAVETTEWPGNVRHLAHAVEAAAIRAAAVGARQIERGHLFGPSGTAPGPTFHEATRRFQAGLLRRALAATGWNVAETARRLDLARPHVHELVRALGLVRDRPRIVPTGRFSRDGQRC
jgi:transcriptional regulator with GAF, ATPase, and Fis domain